MFLVLRWYFLKLTNFGEGKRKRDAVFTYTPIAILGAFFTSQIIRCEDVA
jgi:hypothetical protein